MKIHQIYLSVTLAGIVVLTACAPNDEIQKSSAEFALFDRPQALSFDGNRLLIANSGYSASGWSPGSIDVYDMEQEILIQKLETTAKNPQSFHFYGNKVLVIGTGAYDFSDFEHPISIPPFGIDIFQWSDDGYRHIHWIELSALDRSDSFQAPIEMVTIGNVSLVSSGLSENYWLLHWPDDVGEQQPLIEQVVRTNLTENGLVQLATWQQRFLATNFNNDSILMLEDNGIDVVCEHSLSQAEDYIEGVQTPLVIGNDLIVSFAFSGRISSIDLSTLSESCELEMTDFEYSLGQIPNDLDLVGNELWATVSGENHVARIDLETRTPKGNIVFPISTNPYSLTHSEEQNRTAVSGWGTNMVYFIDPTNGALIPID